MRFFFRSRQFKIIVAVFAAVVLLSAVFGIIGSNISPHANIAGTLAAPFQELATTVKNAFTDFATAYNDGNRLLIENAELTSQINELREQLKDYDTAVEQNAFYEKYFGIKEKNPDFVFTSATVISRDANDPFKGFTLNRGTLEGIHKYDPVITDAGLVGYIAEAGLTSSKVATVLSPDVTMGALDNRTSDSGLISGSLPLAENGLCRFYNLARSCNVAIGDYVVTSGEGIFPDGLLIGTIEEIGSDKYNTSIYANIKPFADITELRKVMVITEFEGKQARPEVSEDE